MGCCLLVRPSSFLGMAAASSALPPAPPDPLAHPSLLLSPISRRAILLNLWPRRYPFMPPSAPPPPSVWLCASCSLCRTASQAQLGELVRG